jgi:hypothetical protein
MSCCWCCCRIGPHVNSHSPPRLSPQREHGGRVQARLAQLGPGRDAGVDEPDAVVADGAVALMDVAKAMHRRPNAARHLLRQIGAPHMLLHPGHKVSTPQRRAVGHQHVDFGRYRCPPCCDGLSTLKIEGPPEPGRPRGAMDGEASGGGDAARVQQVAAPAARGPSQERRSLRGQLFPAGRANIAQAITCGQNARQCG